MNKITVGQKKQVKKLALSFSILAIVVMALSLNEKINSANRPQYVLAGSPDRLDKLNRAIASAEPVDIVEDVRWEHDLVGKLDSVDHRQPASLGQRPSQIDDLRFGELAGKYRISEKSSHIQEIEYVDSTDVADRPIFVRDRGGFLQDHNSLFFVKFESLKREPASTAQSEIYRLFDKTGNPVGQAAFLLDDGGHFISLKVQEVK
jgi:hypothetical protein